jgi:hypothetical protein
MTTSYHKEKNWSDITDAVGMVLFGGLLVLPAILLEGCADKAKALAQPESIKPSPFSFLLRPLQVIAQAAHDGAEMLIRREAGLFGTGIIAAAPSLFAGWKAATALGFSWPALVGGGHLAAMAGAGLAGVAAAVVTFPVAAFAVGSAASLTIAAGLSAIRFRQVGKATGAGVVETCRWRPAKETAAPAAPAPSASPLSPLLKAETPAKLVSDAVRAFNAVTEAMEAGESEERIRYLTALRRKYPAEFAEAARLELHTPELRKGIFVGKPLQFKAAKAHGLKRYMGQRS